MSKILRKIAMALMLVMLTGLLTGCSAGSTVDTVLNINKDLSGTRVMTLVVDQSVFDEEFTGTVEELNAVITEKCPKQLTWAYDDSTGVMVYTFTLKFASPADYKTKVDAIIGEGSDVQITITKSDSVWASGVFVEEKFDTTQLLNWLKTATVEAGFVESSDSSKLFQLGEHKVVFDGEEFSTNSRMYVDNITYVSIESIDLLTDASQLDSYGKTIVMTIPEKSMTLKGTEIKAFLAKNVPAGATATWTQDGKKSVYTVTKTGMTAEGMQTFLNEFFDTDVCTVVQTDIVDDMSPFSFNIGLVETIDFSNYLVGEVINKTDIDYYVKGQNGYVGGRKLSSLASYDESDDVSNEYEGYRPGTIKYDNPLLRDCTAYFQKIYRVKDVSVATNKGLFGGMDRTVAFTLLGEPSEQEQEIILGKINALAPVTENATTTETADETETAISTETTESKKEIEWKVDVTGKAEEGNYVVTIKQSGNREEIRMSSEALYGYAGDLYYAENFHFASINYGLAVYDRFELGDFVDYTTEDVTSTYVLNTGFGSKIEQVNMEEGAVINNEKLTISNTAHHGVNVVTYGNQFNIWALLFYVLIIVAVGCVVIILNQLGVFKMIATFIQEKSAASKAATPVVTATDVKEIEEIPMFCENCGAKRDPDALVCTECGTKFEK